MDEPYKYLLMGFHWYVNEEIVTDLLEKSRCRILEIKSKMKWLLIFSNFSLC